MIAEPDVSHASTLFLLLVTPPALPTFYVATTGDDANPGSQDRPFRTLAKGVSVLTPGATLVVHAGTYAEALLDSIPAGISWSKPVTVKAYPGETVILQPTASRVVYFFQPDTQYIVLDGLVLDGTAIQGECVKITSGAHHIRLRNCELRNAPTIGVLATGDGSDFNEFIGCPIHHNGTTDQHHGVYLSTADNLVDGCTIHDHVGHAVHNYGGTPSRTLIRNNLLYNNAVGIGLYVGDSLLAYNNVIYNAGFTGIYVNYGATNVKVLNNTIDNAAGNDGVYVGAQSANTEVANNLITDCIQRGVEIAATATGVNIHHNVVTGNHPDVLDNSGAATMADNRLDAAYAPAYVDAAGRDYHLTGASSAIVAGQARSEFATDKDGAARGVAWDAGAYQYG